MFKKLSMFVDVVLRERLEASTELQADRIQAFAYAMSLPNDLTHTALDINAGFGGRCSFPKYIKFDGFAEDKYNQALRAIREAHRIESYLSPGARVVVQVELKFYKKSAREEFAILRVCFDERGEFTTPKSGFYQT